MTTATTNTTVEHSSDATFRTWVAEVIAQLLAVGLTQTADTGQINTSTVTRPGTATAAGYAIFRFNDTAHSTTPVFIKLEFGTGSAVTEPAMWITVGQSTNGAGTINSAAITTRVEVTYNGVIASTVTPYVSRFCYNATQGVLWMAWKIGAAGSNLNTSLGGFSIVRSTDSSGGVTTDAVQLITNRPDTAVGTAASPGYAQVISNLTGLGYALGTGGSNWGPHPYGLTSTLYSSNAQAFPVFQYTPIIGINASMALCLQSEVGMNSTVTVALVGATTHTFIQTGGATWGGNTVGSNATSVATIGALMLWE